MDITLAVKELLRDSYQWWGNLETISLSRPSEGFTGVSDILAAPGVMLEWQRGGAIRYSNDLGLTLRNCKRFDIDIRDIPQQRQGGLLSGDLQWVIPVVSLPSGVYPRVADIITDESGVEHTILDTNQNGWRSWYRLNTRNISLAHGLSEVLSFMRPLFVNDGGSKRVSGYEQIGGLVPGKVIEVADEFTDSVIGKRQTRLRYEVHSSRFVRWSPGHQIRSGQLSLQIVSSTAPDLIDGLVIYQCEVVH